MAKDRGCAERVIRYAHGNSYLSVSPLHHSQYSHAAAYYTIALSNNVDVHGKILSFYSSDKQKII